MTDHQKRISAPRNYPVERKDGSYVITSQGPHLQDEGLPLGVVLRDVLGEVDTMAEAKQVLADGKVLVNGRARSNVRSTVGFMDVVAFPDVDMYYRVLVRRDGMVMQDIDADAAETTLARVDDKTTLTGGVTQLNLASGDNIETDEDIDTRGSVLVTLPGLDIEDVVAYEEGNLAYVRGGKHTGAVAEIVDITVTPGSQDNTVTLENEDGTFETVERNVYMVGEDEPVVDIDE